MKVTNECIYKRRTQVKYFYALKENSIVIKLSTSTFFCGKNSPKCEKKGLAKALLEKNGFKKTITIFWPQQSTWCHSCNAWHGSIVTCIARYTPVVATFLETTTYYHYFLLTFVRHHQLHNNARSAIAITQHKGRDLSCHTHCLLHLLLPHSFIRSCLFFIGMWRFNVQISKFFKVIDVLGGCSLNAQCYKLQHYHLWCCMESKSMIWWWQL